MTKQKIIVAVVGTIFLLGGLAVGLNLVGQRQLISKKAAPATEMYIAPSAQSKDPGNTLSFSVEVNTGTNAVTAVTIVINVDPSAIEITSLEAGSGAAGLSSTISNTFDAATGVITYEVYTLNSASALTGSGIEVLKVNANVKPGAPAGSYNITFDPATQAAASGEGQNVLISKTGGSITVLGASGGSTPTPTATSTSESGATPTATSTSTSNSTPTATATSTSSGVGGTSGVTASPTKTATAKPKSTSSASLPETGTSWPTITGITLGVLVIIGSLLLAL